MSNDVEARLARAIVRPVVSFHGPSFDCFFEFLCLISFLPSHAQVLEKTIVKVSHFLPHEWNLLSSRVEYSITAEVVIQ